MAKVADIIERTARALSGKSKHKSDDLRALKTQCQERLQEIEQRQSQITNREHPHALEQGTVEELQSLEREQENLKAEERQLRHRRKSLHEAVRAAEGEEALANAKAHRDAMADVAARVEAARAELNAAVEEAKSSAGRHEQRIRAASDAGLDPTPLYLDRVTAERIGRAIHGPDMKRETRAEVIKTAQSLAKGAA